MAFRTHLGRPLDLRLRSNQAVVALVALSALAALVWWLRGEPAPVFLAPAHAFVLWALVREIDPDHQWSALTAGLLGAVWVLAGNEMVSILAVGGLLVAARLVSATTGRRPLLGDLVVVSAGGVAIGFTAAGWVAGFALAVGLYLDDRKAQASRVVQVAASALTAAGATVVAALAGAFPATLPTVAPGVAVAAGATALILVVRQPLAPISRVDARYAAPLDQDRLHLSRALVGLAVFVMAVFAEEGPRLVPVIVALAFAVVADEFSRRSR